MALFGSSRDISLFRHLNRELMWDIITQQCAIYKFKIKETIINIYGEASKEKFYTEPVLLNMLVERGDQLNPTADLGTSYSREMTFKFFRDDLVDANLVPEVGDIILYQEDYFEIDNVNDNQLFSGKDPQYPYGTNPLNPGLENFGTNLSVIVKAHYVPADKVGISPERL